MNTQIKDLTPGTSVMYDDGHEAAILTIGASPDNGRTVDATMSDGTKTFLMDSDQPHIKPIRIQGQELLVGGQSVNLPALKKAVETMLNLSQEVPGEMMKWDAAALAEMSLPDMKDLWELRSLLKLIDEAMTS